MKVVEIAEQIKPGYFVSFSDEISEMKILVEALFEEDGDTFIEGYTFIEGNVRRTELQLEDDMSFDIISKHKG